jgi:hypothetical protein
MEEEQVRTSSCRQAGEWFLCSGIQETNGGVARYYSSDRKRNAPLSTEIAGYYASALVGLSKYYSDERYLDAAIAAASYLVNAWDADCAAMPFECEASGSRYSYFFDNGIIVRGLLAVWRQCGNEEFLSTATKVCDSMMRDFINGQNFAPILELPHKSPLTDEPARWSRSFGCYQLKAALGWYELSQIINKPGYMECYRRLLQRSLATHASFLPESDSDVSDTDLADTDLRVMDRLHAYSYFLEGLLPVIDEPASREAMADGMERATGLVNKVSPMFLRSDVVAQLLRVRLFAEQHGVLPLDEAAAQNDVLMLQSFQSQDPDIHLNGGFWFGKKNGEMLPFINPASTAFCCHALEMWSQRGQRIYDWHSLI